MAFGTIFTLDTVAERQSATIAEIGETTIWANLDGFFAAHNLLFMQAAEMVAERTTDRMRDYGGTATVDAQELDEFGQPSAQKGLVEGYNVGFPLRRYGNALQWTRFAFENMTVEEFTKQVNAIANADERNLYSAIRRALFSPTNYTFRDWQQMPAVNLPVKALLNADSAVIPNGPTNVTFDGATHTHYLGVTTASTPLVANATAAIDHVVEHFENGQVYLFINKAQEATVRGYAGFYPYVDARLVNQTAAIVASGTLNVSNVYDRAIGLLGSAEVWVKPWIPAGYFFAYVEGQPKPLVLRQPLPESARDLRLVAQDENHPLRAAEWEHRFGVAVWNRANGVVVDGVTGSGTYTAPSV